VNARANWREFPDAAALARALADAVAADLRAGMAARGRATLALSGGATPRAFLRELSRRELDWSRVAVTLADERWVAPDHARSNERLLRETLLQGAAAAAHFVPLHRDVAAPEDAVAAIEADVESWLPFDAVVLGMGLDGHTASLFPGGDALAAALDPSGKSRVMPMRARAAGEPRLTLTLPTLVATRHMYLHIEGIDKRRVHESPDAQTPLASVLAAANAPVDVYWAP